MNLKDSVESLRNCEESLLKFNFSDESEANLAEGLALLKRVNSKLTSVQEFLGQGRRSLGKKYNLARQKRGPAKKQ
jgi:hypothetical protein